MADCNGTNALSLFKLDFTVKELLVYVCVSPNSGANWTPKFPLRIGSSIDLSGSDHQDRETFDSDCYRTDGWLAAKFGFWSSKKDAWFTIKTN